MNNEVEQLKKELMEKSIKIRKKAKEQGICPNCLSPLPKGKRVWCSDSCYLQFMERYDYSQNSPILREKKKEIKARKPKKDLDPWSTVKARKEYECFICGLPIHPREVHKKFVYLPGTEYFDDFPWEASHYHLSCDKFIDTLVDLGYIDGEYDEDDLHWFFGSLGMMYRIPESEIKARIRDGEFTKDQIREAFDKYDPEDQWDFDDWMRYEEGDDLK